MNIFELNDCMDFLAQFEAKLKAGEKMIAEIDLNDLYEKYVEKTIASLEEREQSKLENFSNTKQKEMNYYELLKFLYELGKKQGPVSFRYAK
jgi:hypothetical protein